MSSNLRNIIFLSLVGNSISHRLPLTARQEGGVVGSIPLCVASAEGTLFTEISGILPTAGCPAVIQTSSPIVSPLATEVSITNILTALPETSATSTLARSTFEANLPSFITISADVSGFSETFSQTVFLDLTTLTEIETITTDIAQTDARGSTTTIQAPIVVGPGGIGSIGQNGALPTSVNTDGSGNTPAESNNDNDSKDDTSNTPGGGNNPGGDDNPGRDTNPGGSNNPGGNNPGGDGDDDTTTQTQDETTTSTTTSSTEACVITEIACTQPCTVTAVSGGSALTTNCDSPGLCRRQAGGNECTSTTGTTTTTSFTTASASLFICKAGGCAGLVCGTSSLNIAPALTTNAPGDQIPSLANVLNSPAGRKDRRVTRVDKVVKRVVNADPKDPTSIRQLDFTDPNSLYQDDPEGLSGQGRWYQNAQKLVESQGPGNVADPVGLNEQEGVASSTKFNYADLRQHAITTGSGPTWGCTSVVVYSERGVWIAHFWELEQMQADDFDNQVLNFIRSGQPGRFEGLSPVVPSLFSGPSPGEEEGEILEVPVFSGAIIFTPSFRRNRAVPPGSQATDPIYSDQVNRIKTVLVNQIPGFTLANMNQNINVATYQPVEFEAEMVFNPWLGLLTFEYVPYHTSNDNEACEILRAIRIHIQDEIQSIITWDWFDPSSNSAAGPSNSKNKRQGACPLNLPEILSAQGDGTAEPTSFFDINTPVGGVSPAATSTPLTTSTTDKAPSTAPTGPVLCSNWKLSANGVQIGTNCNGDPNLTVTVKVAPGRRAISTLF